MKQTFEAYGLDGKIKEISVSEDDSISKVHCERCGCLMVFRSGMWHSYCFCPVCEFLYTDIYSEEKEVKTLQRKINGLIDELDYNNNLLKVIKGENNVKSKNMKITEN